MGVTEVFCEPKFTYEWKIAVRFGGKEKINDNIGNPGSIAHLNYTPSISNGGFRT